MFTSLVAYRLDLNIKLQAQNFRKSFITKNSNREDQKMDFFSKMETYNKIDTYSKMDIFDKIHTYNKTEIFDKIHTYNKADKIENCNSIFNYQKTFKSCDGTDLFNQQNQLASPR